ncbi:MAG: tetratricopeptide repeat protein, partial [Helicobacter sp.]|nr:tetratricopeptide repeat protein [Helicobacter sp.]
MINQVKNAFYDSNYSLCFTLCENILKQNPEDTLAIHLAAISSLKINHELSGQYYVQAYNSNPQFFFFLLKIAKDLEGAKETFALADSLGDSATPFKAEAIKELAETYKALNETDRVDEAYTILLRYAPKNLDFWWEFSSFYFGINPSKSLDICIECHNYLLEYIKSIQEEKKEEQEGGVKPLQEVLDSTSYEAVRIQEFLNTRLDVRIAQLFLETFQDSKALEMFFSIQDFNKDDAEFWRNFARALEYSGHYAESEQAYRNAIENDRHPTYKFDLAYLLMRQGNFSEGVELYENRLSYANLAVFSLKHYNQAVEAFLKDPKFLHKKNVFVYCEQGFGDTMIYSRGLEELCRVAKKVLFAPQSALYPLFDHSLKILNKDKNSPFKNLELLKEVPENKEFDYGIPICSIPYFCKIDEVSKFNNLKTPIIPREKDKNKKKTKKVGIFWYTEFDADRNRRNLDLNFILECLKDTPYEIVSLQIGGINLPENVKNVGQNLKDWMDTREALGDIDCLITIDNAISHLGLILEIPTIILLKKRFDWKYGLYEDPKTLFYSKNSYPVVCEDEMKDTVEKVQKILKQTLD